MSEAVLEKVSVPLSGDPEILSLIAEVREVFENHFDRTWFSLVLDGMPIDLRTVRDIRSLVSLTEIFPGEEQHLYQGVLELEKFCNALKRLLLPVLKERLGISWLKPKWRVRDPQQYILRKFVAFTFPYNLERLRRMTQRLKALLLSHYPSLR
ncbi:MAG TPA: hypothetical protein VFH83_04865 [Spirochaetia bacterium]|nr:hypothetical protein [Spirochaetia bacterium]